MASAKAPAPGYRIAIASRTVAAVFGSYGFAILLSFAIARSLAGTMGPRDAVSLAQMIAFVAYAIAVIWAFSCASAARAWGGIAGATALSALWYLLAGGWA